MNARNAGRGQPLLVFAAILGAWLVARVVLWEAPFPLAATPAAAIGHRGDEALVPARIVVSAPIEPPTARADRRIRRELPPRPAAPLFEPLLPPLPASASPFYARRENMPVEPPAPPQLSAAADRPLLGPGVARRESGGARWSGDAWLLWRDGSEAAAAPGAVSYGRSQAGAVLRYRLAPASAVRPAAYLRFTRAIEGPRQAEVAAGLALRPLRGVPVRVAAEARFGETDSGRQLRPAAFAVTELPPAALPLGLRGEAYLQAGYVGGRHETAFVDGQARVDRTVVRLGENEELRAGLGAWGGAQEGAARLDVGPSATLCFKLGEARLRLALDYRLRVAGDAEPASGPALTFSAGF